MPELQRVQCKRERESEREREREKREKKRGWCREKEVMLDKRRNGTMNWELRIENWEKEKEYFQKKNNNDAPHTFPQLSDVANRDWLSLLIPHGLAIFTPTKSVKKLW